jgi:hypothetical protein
MKTPLKPLNKIAGNVLIMALIISVVIGHMLYAVLCMGELFFSFSLLVLNSKS